MQFSTLKLLATIAATFILTDKEVCDNAFSKINKVTRPFNNGTVMKVNQVLNSARELKTVMMIDPLMGVKKIMGYELNRTYPLVKGFHTVTLTETAQQLIVTTINSTGLNNTNQYAYAWSNDMECEIDRKQQTYHEVIAHMVIENERLASHSDRMVNGLNEDIAEYKAKIASIHSLYWSIIELMAVIIFIMGYYIHVASTMRSAADWNKFTANVIFTVVVTICGIYAGSIWKLACFLLKRE